MEQSLVKEDAMNLPNPYTARHEVKLTLMLEPQTSGNFVASYQIKLSLPQLNDPPNPLKKGGPDSKSPFLRGI
jgi:hypothetical protein